MAKFGDSVVIIGYKLQRLMVFPQSMELTNEALSIRNRYLFGFEGSNLWFFDIRKMHEFSEEISLCYHSHDYDNYITENRKWQRHPLSDQGLLAQPRLNKISFTRLRSFRITLKAFEQISSNLTKKPKA